MKKTGLLLTLILFVCFNITAQEISWYKFLKGSIDKYPVSMHLHKMDHAYAGYYYYDLKQEPVYFIGEDTTSKGIITLLAQPKEPNADSEIFSFSTNPAGLQGEWKRNDSSKALTFTAKESTQTDLISFSMIFTNGVVKLRPAMEESPLAVFEASTIWPQINDNSSLFIRQVIGKTFGVKSPVREIGSVLLSNKKQFFARYTEQYKNVKDDQLQEATPTFSEEQTERLMVVYQSKQVLTLARFSFAYTGGAHGNYGTTYTSLDFVKKKILKLTDIISDAGQKRLPALLEKYFRKGYIVDDNTSLKDAGLFEEKIQPNNNFYLTGKGIGFSYPPYEIGPYAMGEIDIFIPFTELKQYLQPGFQLAY